MKNTTKLLLVLMLICKLANSAFSQDKINYLVTRINPKLLDFDKINDTKLKSAPLVYMLNENGKDHLQRLNQNLPFDLNDLQSEKMFLNLTTNDSISISRQGEKVTIPPFWATFRISIPENIKVLNFYSTLKKLYPLVIYVDLPMKIEYLSVPDDTLYNLQNSINPNTAATINVERAWEFETGKSHIKVGVFDTGIDSSHLDLDVVWGHKYSYFTPSDTSWGNDLYGHGTSVAGIIGAKRNNLTGIAGIAGGDNNENDGVSLFDFDLGFIEADHASMAVVDAARSPQTYYDWGYSNVINNEDYNYYSNALGYGIHINNHSYNLKILSVDEIEAGRDYNPDTTVIDMPNYSSTCYLCYESYLFSLKNGVVNVVSRGNGGNSSPSLYHFTDFFPQRLHDSWILTVGASGTDGKRLDFTTFNTAVGENWWSPIGLNLDILAPGSQKDIITTRKNNSLGTQNNSYRYFNGTSASAPHVAGVAALMLSKYNKPCYSNRNLDPADVEQILQKSATRISSNEYNEYEGWGRLDAGKAMELIDYPKYQIVHPIEEPYEVNIISQDTIHAFLNDPFYAENNGPIGSSFPLEITRKYKIVRYEVELKYGFDNYIQPPLSTPAVELLDVWVRHSQTNSLGFVSDTLQFQSQNPAQPLFILVDTIRMEPMAEITTLLSNKVFLKGYYYHFIEKLDNQFFFDENINYWYPVNPFEVNPKMAFTLHLRDTLQTELIDFECDSANILLDPVASVQNLDNIIDFSIYPNPTNDKIFVTSLKWNQKAEILIYDGVGKLQLKQAFVPNQMNEIDTKTLQSGIYFVKLQNENKLLTTKKIIKL